jgi:hypothetical protein
MEKLRTFLELIYFISGPLLLYIAYKGLEQIKLGRIQVNETKEARIMMAKRDAYKISAEKCEYYTSKIIPDIDNLDAEIKAKNIKFFDNSIVEISGDKITVKPNYTDDAEFNLVWELPVLKVFNSLESFSLYFISGVADEKIGFLTIGTTFCHSVKKYLPHLIDLTEDNDFSSIIQLFTLWNARIENNKLEKEKERIENELNKSKPKSINTIGTE